MTPPIRFRRVAPGVGELTRYQVQVTLAYGRVWQPGTVASSLGTSGRRSGAYWQAYIGGDPGRVLRWADVKTKPPMSFRSRKEATDALILHVATDHPDIAPVATHG